MLETIFNKKQGKKGDKVDNDSFLNDELVLSNKTKCDEVMKKYCSLYDEDEKDEKNGRQNQIRPMNQDYVDKKLRREDNLNSTGKDWFNMRVPEMTPEIKEDLMAMNLKKYIDPTQFAKKNDRKTLPKFFQIGRFEDIITDGKANRLRKDEIRSRIAE